MPALTFLVGMSGRELCSNPRDAFASGDMRERERDADQR